MVELIEFEPGRFRFLRKTTPPARSALPMPNVISDAMPPTEQVDGRFYESKAAFRAVGRAHGLTEVGNEKPKPKPRLHSTREQRQRSIGKALARFRAGERPRVR